MMKQRYNDCPTGNANRTGRQSSGKTYRGGLLGAGILSVLLLCACTQGTRETTGVLNAAAVSEGLEECTLSVGADARSLTPFGTPDPTDTPDPTSTPEPTSTPAPANTPVPTPFSVVWLNDTQTMAYCRPDALVTMGKWIADNREEKNILMVVQTGDAVEHGANLMQWAAFEGCYDQFAGDIPYFAIAGNHELGVREQDYTAFLARPYILSLPPEQIYDGGRAAFMTLEAGGEEFLFLGAGWNAETGSVNWMNGVLKEHPDSTAILLFHGFIDTKGELTRVGKELYPKVVLPNENVRMVLCGHIPGRYSRFDQLDDNLDGTPDRTVSLMLCNYQDITDRCGQLRIFTFDPVTRGITVDTYSPVTDVHYRDGSHPEVVYTIENGF